MNESTNVVEVSIQNFQTEVVEQSRQRPVLLEFYANEAEPSRLLAPLLRKLADEYQGKFLLARVSIRENPQLVQQLAVRTLPTVKVIFQGQMVENLEGPLAEPQLRVLLDQLTMSPMEMIRAEIDALIAEGNRQAAIELLQQAITEEPKNYPLHAELADHLIMEGRVDEARKIIAGLPADTAGLGRPQLRIEFMEQASRLPPVAELKATLAKSPTDLQGKLDLAIALVANDETGPALDLLLEVLKTDKQFGDEAARKTMIKVFELLGKGNEMATAYRRKMFTFLH